MKNYPTGNVARVIFPDKPEIDVTPKKGKHFSFEELKEAGEVPDMYFEPIYLPNGYVMMVDEDGRYKQLPLNEQASTIYGRPILGTVFLTLQKNFK